MSLGVSRRDLDLAVQDGTVRRLLHNVYAPAALPLTPQVRAKAAMLVVNSSAVVCDRTAAWVWDAECFEYRELDSPPPIETYVLRGKRATRRPEVRGGTRDLRPEDWVEIGGVKVTTPARTAMDLGCKLGRRSALAAMDALMRSQGFTHAEMRRLLPRYARRRGVVQLRQLIPMVDPRAESPGESWTRLELLDHGLVGVEPQWWVLVAGVPRHRLDLAYPHARVAVEYNGEEFHSSEPAREYDEGRHEWLRKRGWVVIVVEKDSFTEEAVIAWIAEVRGHLERAQRPPGRPTRTW